MNQSMDALHALRSQPHVSVSQIKTFVQCPRKHAFQYVHRMEADFRPIALAFGTAWHAAVGCYLERYASTPETQDTFRDILVREVKEARLPVLFEDDEDLAQSVDLGTRMIDVFVGRVPRPDQVLGVEVAFALEMADPQTGEVLPIPLIGAMDALVVDNDTPTVWELKTGKRRWSADQLEFDLQPTAYRMGARIHGIEQAALDLIVTTKSWKPDVQVERLTRYPVDERDLAHVTASVLRGIEAGVDHPVRGWQCRSCPYASGCR